MTGQEGRPAAPVARRMVMRVPELRRGWLRAVAAASLVVVAACGGSAAQPTAQASGKPIQVGVLDDT